MEGRRARPLLPAEIFTQIAPVRTLPLANHGRICGYCTCYFDPLLFNRPARGLAPCLTKPGFFAPPLALKLIFEEGLSRSGDKTPAGVFLGERETLPVGVRRSMFSNSLAEDPVPRGGGALDRMTSSPDPFLTLNSFEGLTFVGDLDCCATPIRLTAINPANNVSRNRILNFPLLPATGNSVTWCTPCARPSTDAIHSKPGAGEKHFLNGKGATRP